MRKLLLLAAFHCLSAAIAAQSDKADSLLRELSKHSSADTTRLNLLNLAGEQFRFTDTKKGMVLNDEAISLAKKLGNSSGLANAYHIRGYYYYTRGEFETGRNWQLQTLAIAREIRDTVLILKALNRLGVDCTSLSDYRSAMEYLQEGLLIGEKIGRKITKAGITGNIASIYFLLSDYQTALDYAFTSLRLFEELGNRGNVAIMSNNIGSMYLKMQDYDKAIQYNLVALKIADSTGSKKGIGNALLDIGSAYSGQKKFIPAMEHLKRALAIYDSLNAKHNAALAVSAIAAIVNTAPDSILQQLGIKPSERFVQARNYQLKGIELAAGTKNLDNLSAQWKTLSEIYEKRGLYDSAFFALKEYHVIYDSIAGDAKKTEVTRQEMRAEAKRKEIVLNAEHAASLKRQQLIRNMIITAATVLLAALILIFYFYKTRRDALEKQKSAELEMKALRAQIDPHFVFNSLNSISDYISKKDPEAANEYLSKFGHLIRMILENSGKKKVSIAEELAALRIYIELEGSRLGGRLSYNIEIDETIDQENTVIPPLLLQPFVENAIWHGIAPAQGAGRLRLYIGMQGDRLRCTIEDDGVGRKKGVTAMKGQHQSMGMKITSERIALANKESSGMQHVFVEDMAKGTKVELQLPLELRF